MQLLSEFVLLFVLVTTICGVILSSSELELWKLKLLSLFEDDLDTPSQELLGVQLFSRSDDIGTSNIAFSNSTCVVEAIVE